MQRGRWSLEALGKVAVGTMFEDLRIRGGTVITTPDGVATPRTGGLLALSSNIGDQSRPRPRFAAKLWPTAIRQKIDCGAMLV